jgi:hypothetical protein
MQHEQRRDQAVQGCLDGVEVFGAFGQHQHLAALPKASRTSGSNGLGAAGIVGEMSEHVLDARVRRQVDPGVA